MSTEKEWPTDEEWFENDLRDEDRDAFNRLLAAGYPFAALRGCIELATADIEDFLDVYLEEHNTEEDFYVDLFRKEFGITKNLDVLLNYVSFDLFREEQKEITIAYEDGGNIYGFKNQ